MRFFDRKLKGHIIQYVVQCTVAAFSLGIILVYMDIYIDTTVVASMGATSFIIFTMPHKVSSRYRYILGGYTVGIIVGVIFNGLLVLDMSIHANFIGAAAVGLAMFLMVITNTEHPPAAALALGIAINGYSFEMLLFVYSVTLFLLLVKHMIKKWMIDLL